MCGNRTNDTCVGGPWTHARHQTRVEGEVWGPRPAAEHQIIVICPFVFVIGSLGDHCEGLFRAPDLSHHSADREEGEGWSVR